MRAKRAREYRRMAVALPTKRWRRLYRIMKRDHARLRGAAGEGEPSEAAVALTDASMARHKRWLEKPRVMTRDLKPFMQEPRRVPRWAHLGWRAAWHPPERSNRQPAKRR